MKIFTRILYERIKLKVDQEIGIEQVGFRKEVCTRIALFLLFLLGRIIEKCLEMQKDVYLGFLDYSKALIRSIMKYEYKNKNIYQTASINKNLWKYLEACETFGHIIRKLKLVTLSGKLEEVKVSE